MVMIRTADMQDGIPLGYSKYLVPWTASVAPRPRRYMSGAAAPTSAAAVDF